MLAARDADALSLLGATRELVEPAADRERGVLEQMQRGGFLLRAVRLALEDADALLEAGPRAREVPEVEFREALCGGEARAWVRATVRRRLAGRVREGWSG